MCSESIGPTPTYDSLVGRSFLPEKISKGFAGYAVYCTNHTQVRPDRPGLDVPPPTIPM